MEKRTAEASSPNAGGDRTTELVEAATRGDIQAWSVLIERFEPLVRSVTRTYRLRHDDAIDVSQMVWLHLVQHMARLRDPAALAGWIQRTATNECLRILKHRTRHVTVEPATAALIADQTAHAGEPVEAQIIRNEEVVALHRATNRLPDRQRELISLLLQDPAPSYQEIARQHAIPLGAIGPTRARAVVNLRRELAAYDTRRSRLTPA